MTTLYRSPNVILDAHEWHVAVTKTKGRTNTTHYWRPLAGKPTKWRPISAWQGARPKGLGARFWRYRAHIREALEGREERARELARLPRGPATGAMLRNAA